MPCHAPSRRLNLCLALTLTSVALAGCQTTSTDATVGNTTVTTDTTTTGLSVPGISIGGGVGTATVTTAPPATPAAPDPAAAPYLGSWTLARAGDPVCVVDLGNRNPVGDYIARTSRCRSVELARIALWNPAPNGLVIFDFERRPVVTLKQAGPNLFEGTLWDGGRITLWR